MAVAEHDQDATRKLWVPAVLSLARQTVAQPQMTSSVT